MERHKFGNKILKRKVSDRNLDGWYENIVKTNVQRVFTVYRDERNGR